MLFWTFFLGLAIALIFLFFRGGNRNTSIVTEGKIIKDEPATFSKVDKYTNLKNFLEKSFAKKREQKSKFFIIFDEF